MIIDQVRSQIYKELPKSWGVFRKTSAADRILEPLLEYVREVQAEHDALDAAIDALLNKLETPTYEEGG